MRIVKNKIKKYAILIILEQKYEAKRIKNLKTKNINNQVRKGNLYKNKN